MDYREQAYDELMVRLGKTFGKQPELATRLNATLNLLEELWPEAVANSRKRHGIHEGNEKR